MDSTSIPCDPARTEIALVWLHLPSGAAAIQGIVRHADGGPIVAGAAVRGRPLAAGGTEVLHNGADPTTNRFTADPRTWAVTEPDAVQEQVMLRGWQLISRRKAAAILDAQSYLLRSSSAPGHVVHEDQADDMVWHYKASRDGRPSTYTWAAFVVRPMLEPGTTPRPPTATPERSGMLGLEPDSFRIIGLALAEFAAGEARDSVDDENREQAGFLHETLISWGYVNPEKPSG